MLISRAMPDKDRAAKAIDSAQQSALESVGAYRAIPPSIVRLEPVM